ncbi:hypothetical protein F4680DRAFT_452430 [Xylaria scruposa]|nr:hypothetical protein F4680DRAFT_452430 [Xylaria scruposa]
MLKSQIIRPEITHWIDSVNHSHYARTLDPVQYALTFGPSQSHIPIDEDDGLTDGDTVINTNVDAYSDSMPSTLSFDDDMDPKDVHTNPICFRSEEAIATPTLDRQVTLGYHDKSLNVEQIHENQDKIPNDMLALWKTIRKADPYRKVVPHDELHSRPNSGIGFHDRGSRLPGLRQVPIGVTVQPGNLTTLQRTLKSIVDEAWDCYQEDLPVARWNNLVYRPILNLGFGFSTSSFISFDVLDEGAQKPVVAGSDTDLNLTAISIAARSNSEQQEPLVRLGIRTAAWHEYIMKNSAKPRKSMLIPVIKICDHNWIMYYACDSGYSVDMYGPMRLGSTHSVLDASVLISSLQLLKQWIKTHFYARIWDR